MQLVGQQQDSLCTVWSGGPAPTHAHCGLVSFLPTELRIYMDEGFMARSSLSELGQAHGSRGASSWLCVRGGRSVEQCTHAAFSRKGSLQLRRVHLAALSERKKKIAEAAMGCAPRSPFWLPLGKQWHGNNGGRSPFSQAEAQPGSCRERGLVGIPARRLQGELLRGAGLLLGQQKG